MKRIFNTTLVLAVLMGTVLYLTIGGLWLKALTSLGFVVLGVGNDLLSRNRLSRGTGRFSHWMILGLLLCMLGDVVINLEFISGAIVFALGHVSYVAAYGCLLPMRNLDFRIGGGVFSCSVLILLGLPMLDFGSGLMKLVCILYALVISLMVGKAIGNHIRLREPVTALLAAGSVLFFLSDFMLLLDVFADAPRITIWLCLLFYYPAQCLLAGALACKRN